MVMLILKLWLSSTLLIQVCSAINCLDYDHAANITQEKQCKSDYNACVLWGYPSSNTVITKRACWIDTADNCTLGPCEPKRLDNVGTVVYYCCCRGDFCNRIPEILLHPTDTPSYTRIQIESPSPWFLPSLIIPCLFAIAILAMVTYCALRRRRLRRYMQHVKKVDMKKTGSPKIDLTKQLCSTYGSFSTQIWLAGHRSSTSTTASKSSNQTKHLLREEQLTVRVSDQASAVRWTQETRLLSSVSLSHPHVVSVLWWGKKHHKTWLVYEDVFLGTLTHILHNCTMSIEQVTKLSNGIFSGLAYLHCTIHAGSRSKPALAHRDVRPDNILLKHNYVPVLGNFHCATRLELCNYDNLTVSVETLSKLISTNHYLPPELFTNTKHYLSLSAFMQMDVYSTSLVLWQMLTRCVQGGVMPYTLPYENLVGEHPTLQDMDTVLRTTRPTIHTYWKQNKTINQVCYVLQLCWSPDPSLRLTAHYLQRVFSSPATLDVLCGNITSV